MQVNHDPECVRIKREAQERIARATAGLSPHDRDVYVNHESEEFARALGITQVSAPVGRGAAVGSPATAHARQADTPRLDSGTAP